MNLTTASKFMKGILLSVILLGLCVGGYAQENLVNLYTWTVETTTPPGAYANPTGSVTALSSRSALLYSGQNVFTNSSTFGPNNPTFSGSLSTKPDTLYEIFCTLQDDSQWLCQPSLTFGAFTTNFNLPNLGGPNPGFGGPPVNIDFTVWATSSSTTMSINPNLYDYPGEVSLSNFSVVEVPEVPAAGLLRLGGGVWLFALCWRRFLQKRK